MIGAKSITAALLLSMCAGAAHAQNPQSDAEAHNAAFQVGATNGIEPQTMGEMLICAALWDRWKFAVDSSANGGFKHALRKELGSSYAKKKAFSWTRAARREMYDEDDSSYFDKIRGKSEGEADKLYAAYINNEERGMTNLMDWLGVCR